MTQCVIFLFAFAFGEMYTQHICIQINEKEYDTLLRHDGQTTHFFRTTLSIAVVVYNQNGKRLFLVLLSLFFSVQPKTDWAKWANRDKSNRTIGEKKTEPLTPLFRSFLVGLDPLGNG
jgi:hypothetical protein